MQQNASTEYKSATNQVKQLYKAFWVTGTAFFMWKLELFYTRLKRNKIFAEQWNTSSKKVYVIMLNVMLNIKRLLQ
jgi:hypothetical protein